MGENGFQAAKSVPLATISSVFKNWFPLISVTVSASKKNFQVKGENPSPIAGIQNSFNKTFVLDGKKSFHWQECPKKICKKWLVRARNSVSATRNKALVEKYVSAIRKDRFFWQRNQRRWFTLGRKLFF